MCALLVRLPDVNVLAVDDIAPEVADELGCDWKTVMAAVRSDGTPLTET